LRLPFSYARLVCKPSSVLNGHLSRTYISARLKRCGELAGHFLCSRSCIEWGLHRALLPNCGWALTSPFHPYRKCGGFFLLHCPWSRLHRELPGTHALWCSDFPQIFHATVRL